MHNNHTVPTLRSREVMNKHPEVTDHPPSKHKISHLIIDNYNMAAMAATDGHLKTMDTIHLMDTKAKVPHNSMEATVATVVCSLKCLLKDTALVMDLHHGMGPTQDQDMVLHKHGTMEAMEAMGCPPKFLPVMALTTAIATTILKYKTKDMVLPATVDTPEHN